MLVKFLASDPESEAFFQLRLTIELQGDDEKPSAAPTFIDPVEV
jgi:hypothetical protein